MQGPTAQQKKQFVQILKKAKQDKAFRKRLLERAEETLKQEGVAIPTGIHVKCLEKQNNTYYLFLPSEYEELSEAEMMAMAGGRQMVGHIYDSGEDQGHNS